MYLWARVKTSEPGKRPLLGQTWGLWALDAVNTQLVKSKLASLSRSYLLHFHLSLKNMLWCLFHQGAAVKLPINKVLFLRAWRLCRVYLVGCASSASLCRWKQGNVLKVPGTMETPDMLLYRFSTSPNSSIMRKPDDTRRNYNLL